MKTLLTNKVYCNVSYLNFYCTELVQLYRTSNKSINFLTNKTKNNPIRIFVKQGTQTCIVSVLILIVLSLFIFQGTPTFHGSNPLGAFHLPTRGPWVGTRGKKSIFSGREFVRGQFRQQGRVGSVARRRSVGEGWGLQTR